MKMTGLGAVAGAPGDAQTRALDAEARKSRAETDATRAAEPPPEEARTTEAAVREAEFDRQDEERPEAERQQNGAHDKGSLLDVVV